MDTLQRQGKYPVPSGASSILGVEFAGLVEKIGAGVPSSAKVKVGDRVFGLVSGGAYAELVAIDYRMTMMMTDEQSFEKAAAIPEAFLTAYQALFTIAQLKKGESVLIHAGASGVGTSAIQLAKLSGASQIFSTCGSEEKSKLIGKLGVTDVINYKKQDFKEIVEQNAKSGHPDNQGGKGVDVIVDFIGASYLENNIQALAIDGRMVLLSLLGGSKLNDLDILPIMFKRLRIEGSMLRARSREYQIRLHDGFLRDFGQHLEAGKLEPVIHCVLPWTEIAEAHRIMEDNENVGKIVMKLE